jgi:hypothetical protein
MRDLAGSCANIHARRCRPLRDPTRTHGCQRFSTGVGTDPTSKAIGCPDLGNDHLIVMTNLRARQAAVANLTLVAAFGGTNDGMHRPIRTPISLLQALLGPFRAATNWCQELFRTVSRPRTPGLPSEFTALEMALSRPGL